MASSPSDSPPGTTPYRGPVLGLVGTLLTYVVAFAPIPVFMIAITIPDPNSFVTVENAVSVNLLFVAFGFLYTFWLALPIGAVSGWVHERAVAEP